MITGSYTYTILKNSHRIIDYNGAIVHINHSLHKFLKKHFYSWFWGEKTFQVYDYPVYNTKAELLVFKKYHFEFCVYTDSKQNEIYICENSLKELFKDIPMVLYFDFI